MGFFDGLFGKQDGEGTPSRLPWIALTSTADLDEAIEISKTRPVVLFKHSTRCSISRFSLKRFEREFPSDSAASLYYLDLLEYRDVSNTIAEKLGVQHQSPQVIVLRDGLVVYHTSHEDIHASEVMAHF